MKTEANIIHYFDLRDDISEHSPNRIPKYYS